MATKLNPYLTFIAKARSVMEFYSSVFGGELTLQTFKEMHAAQSPEQEELIMHGQLTTKDGMTLMASDDPEGVNESKNVSILLSGEDETVLADYWAKLSDGATVIKPFDAFGILTDKFGVRWLISVVKSKG